MYVSGYLGQTPPPAGAAAAPAIDWSAVLPSTVGVFRVKARALGFILDPKASGTIDRTAWAALASIIGPSMANIAVAQGMPNVEATWQAQKNALDSAIAQLEMDGGNKAKVAGWKNRQYAFLYPHAMRPAVAGAAAGVGLAAVIAGLILL